MASSFVVPKFENETEEADWWYANRDAVEQEFRLAAKEGRLGRGTLKQRALEAEAKKQSALPVALDVEDARKASIAAARKGITYETYVRQLFHEALEKDLAAETASAA